MCSATNDKPRLFVGTAEESSELVRAIRKNIGERVAVKSWREAFPSGEFVLESFLKAVRAHAFGLFILTPAAQTIENSGAKNERRWWSPRDNVVLEVGAFLAKYGRAHTLIMAPQDISDFKIPTDLKGLTIIGYEYEMLELASDDIGAVADALAGPSDTALEQIMSAHRVDLEEAATKKRESDAAQETSVIAAQRAGRQAEPTSALPQSTVSGWGFAVASLTPITHGQVFVGSQVVHGLHGLGQVIGIYETDGIEYASVRFGAQHVSIPLTGEPQLFNPFRTR